jgi:hypothetical protein
MAVIFRMAGINVRPYTPEIRNEAELTSEGTSSPLLLSTNYNVIQTRLEENINNIIIG